MRTVFLLGSGISLDAGLPTVGAITDQVLSGKGVWRHSDGQFVLDGSNPNYATHRAPVEPILRLLEDLRVGATIGGVAPTYEGFALLAQQVGDALSGEYESAAVIPFAAQVAWRAGVDRAGLQALCHQTLHYIADTVSAMLRSPPSGLSHLDAIVNACRHLGKVDLATLNHDTLLETALDTAGVDYADGFELIEEDVCFWTDEWHDTRVRLFKLHGSIDWFAFQTKERSRGWRVARHTGRDVDHPSRRDLDGPASPRPILLTGTFTKILGYESWNFPDQHWRLHEALREATRVVAIGYSFNDKAINSRLIAWLDRRPNNRLIVCHGNPDDVREAARDAVASRWDGWLAARRLSVIPMFIAELTYERLAAELGQS